MSNTNNQSRGNLIAAVAKDGMTAALSVTELLIRFGVVLVVWVTLLTLSYYIFGPTGHFYVPAVISFAKGVSVFMTFMIAVMLLLIYMSSMVGVMLLRRVFSVVGYIPNFIVSMIEEGKTFPATITDEYIDDLKKMLGDKLAWAGVYCSIVGLLPLEAVPWSPMVIFAMMVFLAFQQAGWKEKPPKIARWLAYFLLTSIVSWVIAHGLYRFMKHDSDQINNSFVTFVDAIGDASKNGLNKASLWITKTMGTENHEVQLKEAVALSNGPSKDGQRVLQLLVEKQTIPQGGDTSIQDLAIRFACETINDDDCLIPNIAGACVEYCVKR